MRNPLMNLSSSVVVNANKKNPLKMHVLWDVMPCCMVDVYRSFRANDASISTLLMDAAGFSNCQ